jgi:hypothetical protein
MSGNPLLYASLSGFMLSVNLLLLGLIAEMLARTYHESQRKPIYVVKEIIQCSPSELLSEIAEDGLPASRK